MKNCVVLGLGSNKEYDGRSPLKLLRNAVKLISHYVEGVQLSSVYKSSAMYLTDQADFFNMALCGFYEGDAPSLLQKIHKTESDLGRNRTLEIRNGPRSIDIDIELFARQNINTAELTVPHPRFKERAFVLKPLVEILSNNADTYKKNGGSNLQNFDSLLFYGIDFAQDCLRNPQVLNQDICLFMNRDEFLALAV